MGIFPNKTSDLLPKAEADEVVTAIRHAEGITSGEVRVFIESRCSYVNAIDRAWEIFRKLKMEATRERNAVLVYMALLDRQIAIIGDEGIHQRVGQDNFWKQELETLKNFCKEGKIKEGLKTVVTEIGQALSVHFPARANEDHNEIPDDIVFGQ
ncbi:MAG: hypothetical protein BGO31_08910 [Bacteroidetes bacterium 43-16]|nr:MAG: hypothetical protein BGO31_08910 [Bacteroidetes bacterium 43-16]